MAGLLTRRPWANGRLQIFKNILLYFINNLTCFSQIKKKSNGDQIFDNKSQGQMHQPFTIHNFLELFPTASDSVSIRSSCYIICIYIEIFKVISTNVHAGVLAFHLFHIRVFRVRLFRICLFRVRLFRVRHLQPIKLRITSISFSCF